MERGEKDEAERVYSAIVELLPRDADAQRALATLLKQRGDLPAAMARLHAALEARPDDPLEHLLVNAGRDVTAVRFVGSETREARELWVASRRGIGIGAGPAR